MKLKLALITTGAAGAIAAGGFAYATVGSSSPTTSAKLPDAASAVQPAPAVPRSLPTCVPDVTKGKELPKVPGKLPKAPEAGQLPSVPGEDKLPKVPGTDQLPKVPDTDQLNKVPGTDKLNKVPGTDKLPQAPADLPTCTPQLPTEKKLPAMPAKPDVPGVQNVASCSSVPPAIKMAHGRAKDFTLPNGMHLAFAHTHMVMIDGQKVCGKIEKFVGTAGQSFTVERLNTPPQTTVQEVAEALKLPDTGKVVSLGGGNMWQSPLNTGSMWISDKGYALNVSGSPAMVAEIPAIVSQLRHTA